MSNIAKSCVLQCVKNPSKRINLPHKITVYLGRNEESMITDTSLSRKQIAATADYAAHEVGIETLGINYCGCNGYALRKGKIYKLKHGDRIELLIGNHEFDVVFESDDTNGDSLQPDSKRPKVNYSIFNLSKNAKDIKDSQDNPMETEATSKWEIIENGALLIYNYLDVQSQSKIAAFDLDGTLIRTKSGARFAKNSDDWSLLLPEVKSKLSKLQDENYKIVVFTNQGGVKSDPAKRNEFKRRAEAVLSCIRLPVQLFAATTNSIYRKPVLGMWNAMCNEKNDQISIDMENSFYVGDAAGREKDWAPKKNKDHSLGDRLFALNIGIKFYTPEEFFLGARAVPHIMPKFDPKNLKVSTIEPQYKDECEVVVVVGSPGSGKSHYSKEHFVKNGYVYVNRDTLGAWQACVKLLEKSVQSGQSVVIDNTNGDKATRKRYIDVAKKLNIPCRCFVMTTTPQHCKHNNKFRQLIDTNHAVISEIILNMYKKNYEEPAPAEGFDEIVNVDFVPEFYNKDHEKLYNMFLLES